MSKLAYIYHPVYLKHDTGPLHPEKYQRLTAINSHLEEIGFYNKIERIEPKPADLSTIEQVHDKSYIQEVSEAIKNKQYVLDQGDTVVGDDSFDAALYAVGAVTTGLDLIESGQFDKIFCAVRPPGHHAEKNFAMGFCIFNNITLAARYAQKKGIADNILIVDWDVHHGNGTQHLFENDNTVFYYSIHQFPFYPGTGSANEQGIDNGTGFTLNRPLSTGCKEQDYIDAFEVDMISIQNNFKPDLILISAGFDAHKDDSMAGMLLTEKAYVQMTEILAKMALKYANGRILSVLEGGYNLKALATSVEAHLDVLLKY
ncbi:histone deacetylase [Calditrichota bacterium]